MSVVTDFQFFSHVLNEQLCMSLENCSQPQEHSVNDEISQSEVLLHYPQAVALESLDR